MKRLLCLFITLVLSLPLVCCAMAEEKTFTTPYFTLTLPDGWIIDQENLKEGSEEGMEYLGLFYTPEEIGLEVTAYLVYYNHLKNMALWSADKDELKDYVNVVLEDFKEDHPVHLDTVMAGSIPFVLIKCTDKDGDYLYADTITNGYAIEFLAYVTDAEEKYQFPITDDYVEQFKNILSTFMPLG